MNADEQRLVDDYLHGRLAPEQRGALNDLLRFDAGARACLQMEAAMETRLRELAMEPLPQRSTAPVVVRWFQWRPLAAAAAGLVIGLLCASMVFAYALPRAVTTSARILALMDGSFEGPRGRLQSGFPLQFGVWSGDEAEIISGVAKDGKQSLRFVRAEGDAVVGKNPASACDIFQLVDLRGMNPERRNEDAILELSVAFRDARATTGERVRFDCRVFVFAGDPSRVRGEWPLSMSEALAAGTGGALSNGGAPSHWQVVTAKAVLPAKAEFAVVQVLATKAASGDQAAEFGEQFADDVRLTLKTQPTLPVRTARR